MNRNSDKQNLHNNLKLWYQQPAEKWQDAMPIGNGRIGAMIYGDPCEEIIDLTEVTCFSGEAPKVSAPDNAPDYFMKARKAALEGDYEGARQYIKSYIGKRQNYGTNLPLGHLSIKMLHENEGIDRYSRDLMLDQALAGVSYCIKDKTFNSTSFVSNPHQVFVMKITSNIPDAINLTLSLDGGQNPCKVEIDKNNDILLFGNAYESVHSDGKTGVAFHSRTRLIAKGGNVSVEGDRLCVKGSGEVLTLTAIGTSFGGRDPIKDCEYTISQASVLSYEELLNAHIKDYGKLFNRVMLKLDDGDKQDLPTDLRLEQLRNGCDDNSLTALMFQYGRYLLISASRENSPLPVHLQGVWNDNVASRIGWTCDMHLDINTQMNYWPAEVTNLSECHEPLFRWIENDLVPSGRVSAKNYYGLKGWTAELVSNAWGYTAPYWHTNLSPCPTGGAWAATHIWEHYLYIGDMEFLKTRAFPVIKEAAEFFLEYVFEDPQTGHLACGPSISPENAFIVDGKKYMASISPTYEIVLIREIFNDYISAAEALGYKDDFTASVRSAVKKLPPFEIGASGELKEWQHDFSAADSQHRHTSHLLSLYPFGQITPDNTPELAEAAKTSIRQRMTPEEGWEDTGWARSMLMLYSARLKDNEDVYRHILSMQKYLTNNNLMVKHPPTRGAPAFADVYELDGNTGLTACIAEALLQSHNDEIQLLPALPSCWKNGHVKGLCARGGFQVDMEWQNGILKEAVICSKFDTTCIIRYGKAKEYFAAEAGRKYTIDSSCAVKEA